MPGNSPALYRRIGTSAAALFLYLVLAGNAAAQGTSTVTEDFSDDETGIFPNLSSPVFPTATWYNFSVVSNVGNTNPYVTTGDWLQMERTASYTRTNAAVFELNVPGPAVSFEFAAENAQTAGTGSRTSALIFWDANHTEFLSLVSAGIVTGATPEFIIQTAGNPECTVIGGAGTAVSNQGVFTNLFLITFDWVNRLVVISNPGDNDGTVLSCTFTVGSPGLDLGYIEIDDTGTANRASYARFDSFTLIGIAEGAAPPEETPATNPVSAARDYFAVSWGLSVTAASWLFGMLIVAISVSGVETPLKVALFALLGIGAAMWLGFLPLWLLLTVIFLIIALASAVLFRGNEGDSS